MKLHMVSTNYHKNKKSSRVQMGPNYKSQCLFKQKNIVDVNFSLCNLIFRYPILVTDANQGEYYVSVKCDYLNNGYEICYRILSTSFQDSTTCLINCVHVLFHETIVVSVLLYFSQYNCIIALTNSYQNAYFKRWPNTVARLFYICVENILNFAD